MYQSVASELLSEIVAIRRDIHMYPELGFEEHRTTSVVADYLSKLPGFEVYRDITPTGVVGVLNGERTSYGVALRADIDALPIVEESGVPYSSRNTGIMHACGHDGHTAALLGAARVLSEQRDAIPGRVILIFQPAEEQLGGAREMCRAGVIERFGIKAIFGLHGWPGEPFGSVCVAEREAMAASDPLVIEIEGKGAHASMPHLSFDPIAAGADIVRTLLALPVRRHDPKVPSVLSFGAFHAGTKGNVIPDRASLLGTLRTLTPDVREYMMTLVEQTIRHVVALHGCTAKVRMEGGYPPVINTPAEVALVQNVAEKLVSKSGCSFQYPPVLAGEDFAYYLEKVPGAFYFLGLGDTSPLHNSHFDFEEKVLPLAVNMHATLALEWWRKASLS